MKKSKRAVKRSGVVFYPLSITLDVECPAGHFHIQRRGVTEEQITALVKGFETGLKQTGLLQVFDRATVAASRELRRKKRA